MIIMNLKCLIYFIHIFLLFLTRFRLSPTTTPNVIKKKKQNRCYVMLDKNEVGIEVCRPKILTL